MQPNTRGDVLKSLFVIYCEPDTYFNGPLLVIMFRYMEKTQQSKLTRAYDSMGDRSTKGN